MTDGRTIRPGGPVAISVRPPGSKSITNRALILAALAEGESRIIRPLLSDDTAAMRTSLTKLGIDIADFDGDLIVKGGRFHTAESILDVNLSGTALRFLVALAALAPGETIVDGGPRIRERPISALTEALKQLGVDVSTDAVTGGAPVRIAGGRLRGGEVQMDASLSSQPVSALMMVAPYADATVTIEFKDGVSISSTYLQTTAEVMGGFGILPALAADRVTVPVGRYQPIDYVVEADASAAVYPWCAAAITGGSASVVGIAPDSTQSDLGVLDALVAMGCTVERSERDITVRGPNRLQGVDIDLGHCPDGAMAVAVCAAFGSGPSTITGLSSWSVKETDRLTAVSTELSKMGVVVRTTDDSLSIEPPGQIRPALVSTYDDHRMAMSFSLAGLNVSGVQIEDPEVVSKTWPGYWIEMDRWT